jgi:hypothetical protein
MVLLEGIANMVGRSRRKFSMDIRLHTSMSLTFEFLGEHAHTLRSVLYHTAAYMSSSNKSM